MTTHFTSGVTNVATGGTGEKLKQPALKINYRQKKKIVDFLIFSKLGEGVVLIGNEKSLKSQNCRL